MYLYPSKQEAARSRCRTGPCLAALTKKTSNSRTASSSQSIAPKPSTTSLAAGGNSSEAPTAFWDEMDVLRRIAERRRFRVIEDASTGFRKQFKFGKNLGAGAYGKVQLCKRTRDGAMFAVKIIPKRRLLADCRSTEIQLRLIRALRNEVAVLRLASSHPNVASLYDVYEDSAHIFLVLEHCTGGELFDKLVADGSLDEAKAAAITKQLCAVLKFLHEKCGVVHCDLKPANILLADAHSLNIKLVDFGMAHILEPDEFQSIPGGSPMYTAPEVIETRARKSRYAHPCDMWSLGVVLFAMIFKFPPFVATATECNGKSARQLRKTIFRKVLKGFTPKVLSVEEFGYGPWFPDAIPSSTGVRDLISQLLCFDATKRMTATQALDHVWLREHAEGGLYD